MKISKISIDNFRSKEHLEVLFGRQLTLLLHFLFFPIMVLVVPCLMFLFAGGDSLKAI